VTDHRNRDPLANDSDKTKKIIKVRKSNLRVASRRGDVGINCEKRDCPFKDSKIYRCP